MTQMINEQYRTTVAASAAWYRNEHCWNCETAADKRRERTARTIGMAARPQVVKLLHKP